MHYRCLDEGLDPVALCYRTERRGGMVAGGKGVSRGVGKRLVRRCQGCVWSVSSHLPDVGVLSKELDRMCMPSGLEVEEEAEGGQREERGGVAGG